MTVASRSGDLQAGGQREAGSIRMGRMMIMMIGLAIAVAMSGGPQSSRAEASTVKEQKEDKKNRKQKKEKKDKKGKKSDDKAMRGDNPVDSVNKAFDGFKKGSGGVKDDAGKARNSVNDTYDRSKAR